MPHMDHEEHRKHHKPEAECACDKDCKCGCQEGKPCTCGEECHCGCGCCGGHCRCKKAFAKILLAIILFLAGFGLACVCHCCGCRSHMMKAPHHMMMPGEGAGSVVIINTDGHVGFDQFRGKHHHGKHHGRHHMKADNAPEAVNNNTEESSVEE